MTLPLIYTLQQVDSSKRKELIRTVEKFNTDKSKVRDLILQVHQSGGIKYAHQVMDEYVKKALRMVEEIPASPATSSMKQLIGYVIARGN